MTWIDAHCHLADPRFDEIREQVVVRAKQAGIRYFFQGGVDPDDWQRQEALADEFWFRSYGLHPWWVANHTPAEHQVAYEQLVDALPKAHALGELGLDFLPRFAKETHPHQLLMFQKQLALAQSFEKPLVLHIVRAHDAALRELKRFSGLKGMVHAFTGSLELANAYMKLGFLISIGGTVTQERAIKLKKAVYGLPLEKIIIESDAPDMKPRGFDGALNEPIGLLITAREVADIKNVTVERVLAQSKKNLAQCFDLELGE